MDWFLATPREIYVINGMECLQPLPISVSIVACNEANNLKRCLDSVRDWTAEIVVVLNNTTDDSERIAVSLGARVLTTEWQGFRDTKNWALNQSRQPWALCLDADEAVSPQLRASIEAFFSSGKCNQMHAAEAPRLSWFLNRWIRHGDWYPDRCLRLIRLGKGSWGGDPAHTHIVTVGQAVRLSGNLLHYPFPDLKTFMLKSVRQSDDFARIQKERGRRWNLLATLFRPIWRGLRAYFFRAGFLDGFPGLYIAVATSFVTFLRYSRLYENERSIPAGK